MKKCLIYSGYLSLGFIALLVTVSGCYYDKEELLYPNAFTCTDTTAATYNTVLPIVTANCYGCHAGSFPSGGIKLDSYNDLKANVVKVYGAITHSSGFQPMPKNGNMLSACNIATVKKWIDAGTPP